MKSELRAPLCADHFVSIRGVFIATLSPEVGHRLFDELRYPLERVYADIGDELRYGVTRALRVDDEE